MVALLFEHRTYNQEIKGSTPGWAPLHSNAVQVIHAITKQYNLTLAQHNDALMLQR